MRWPWSRREKRDSSYADEVIALLLARAGNVTAGDPQMTAALEACVSVYSTAFAGAKVTPEDSDAARALTPSCRASIARRMLRYGESVDLIQIIRGEIRLAQSGTWDIRGGADPDSWTYRLDLFGPSESVSRVVLPAGVVHCRLSTNPSTPWRGTSPLGWARDVGTLAANAEKRLGQEAGGPVGSVIPVPDDGGEGDDDDDPLETLRADIAKLKGNVALVETAFAGWGEGKAAAPKGDWEPRRIGANPPDAMVKLRWDAMLGVANACGVPVSLLTDADGTSQREAWRRFVMGSVEPLASLVLDEVRAKLDEPSLAFDFSCLWAHDLAGRAAAFQKLIVGGMDATKAAALSGLTGET